MLLALYLPIITSGLHGLLSCCTALQLFMPEVIHVQKSLLLESKSVLELDPPSLETKWLVEGLWPAEGLGFLAGHPKLGKTWVALDFAVSVASGAKCMGHFPVQKGAVLYLPGEGKESRIRQRIEMIARKRGVKRMRTLDLRVLTVPGFRLDSPEDQERLRATIEHHRPSLLILDPLRRLLSGDENSSGVIAPVLNFLTHLQRTLHCAIMVVHHTHKGKQDKGGQALRGSGDMHAWGDANLYLRQSREHEGATLMVPELRDEAADSNFVFKVVEGEYDSASAEVVEVKSKDDLAESPKIGRPKSPIGVDVSRIEHIVRKVGEVKKSELKKASSMNSARFYSALKASIDSGALILSRDENSSRPNSTLVRMRC